jgi:hypothetical protein
MSAMDRTYLCAIVLFGSCPGGRDAGKYQPRVDFTFVTRTRGQFEVNVKFTARFNLRFAILSAAQEVALAAAMAQ